MNRREFLKRAYQIGGLAALYGLGVSRAEAWLMMGPTQPTAGYTLEQDWPVSKDVEASTSIGNDNTGGAGRFTADANYTLTKAAFCCHSVTLSPTHTLTGKIYSKTSDTAYEDEPNALLATSTNTVDASTLVAGVYFEFLFAGLALTSGEDYWAFCETNGTDASNYFNLRYDSTGSGSRVSRYIAGTWYNVDTSAEMYLKLYSGG